LVPATRARITGDAQRAAQILRDAGRDFRTVATNASSALPTGPISPQPRSRPGARKSGRKTAGRARKAA
jgi:hypothetical protein